MKKKQIEKNFFFLRMFVRLRQKKTYRTADQTDLLRADQSDLLLADQTDLLPISTKSRKADQTDLPTITTLRHTFFSEQ